MAAIIKLRRDTLTNWELSNPILAEGEVALVVDVNGDTSDMRIGNGVSNFIDINNFSPAVLQSQFAKLQATETEFGGAKMSLTGTTLTITTV